MMEYWFIWLFVFLVWAAFNGAVAQHISQSRGYSDGFGLGFWLGIYGVLIVIGRPVAAERLAQVTAPSPSVTGETVEAASFDATKADKITGAVGTGALIVFVVVIIIYALG